MRQQQLFIHVGMHIGLQTSKRILNILCMSSFKLFGKLTAIVVSRRELVVYVNSFSGDATVELPSTLQMARGGVCILSCLTIFFTVLFILKDLDFQIFVL